MRVRLEKIHKSFGPVEVVKGIDLEVQDGEFLVLLGASGSGKTTALRMIAGLEKVTSGRIRIGDRDVTDVLPKYRDVAMVFQSYALYPHMTVFANIAYPLTVRGEAKADVEAAVQRLRSDEQMLGLADAARSRSEADWLVGINGTRAMTAFNSRDGGFFLTTVGRVQTPTLSLVVEREEKIRKFVSRDYWEIHAGFQAEAGQYLGKWFDPKWKKSEDPEARADRCWSLREAEAIAHAVRGKAATVTEESKPTTQASPLLFDLTSLQREANGKFGFSAKTTLALAQSLYERHKALTYPRTDSRALPEDYLPVARNTFAMLAGSGMRHLAPSAQQALDDGYVRPSKRIFDNGKVSDHFSIIPTTQAPHGLSEAEQKLYDLVVRRFMAVFFPSAEYQVTTRISQVVGHSFKTEGKVLVKPGWLAIYGKEAANEVEDGKAGDKDRKSVV